MICDTADKDRDAKHYVRVKKAMGMLGLGDAEVREILGVLSAIMHLGNIEVCYQLYFFIVYIFTLY